MVAAPTPAAAFLSPIVGGLSRVTKKSFGLYVTPKDSPVQPERFSGYHTGLDFETTPTEQGTDVVITAACDGTLLVKRTASGYGGVAVQSCQLNGQEVTVIYGHLQLASLTAKVGASLKAGDRLGVLGRGYSPETDGERQHLHFAIHVGNAVSLLGYVPTKAALAGWLDPAKLMSQ
jgi:murein DD-endopeptidase MepM/ murein hydrolase activator NlpD